MRTYSFPILPILLLFSCNCYCQGVDGGNGHSIILDEHGSVWTIGRNNHGQLGTGDFENSSVPVLVKTLPPIDLISRGYDHSIAIDTSGNIWSWGLNNYGQLGTNALGDRHSPVMLKGHTNFVSVEGGHWHTIALKEDGSVWSWGHNYYGELGHNNREHCSFPKRVLFQKDTNSLLEPLSGIADIKSVGYHTLALDSNGIVWGWGPNSFHQLLPEKSEIIATAVVIPNLPTIESIAVGWHHSIALDIEGNIWAWGSDPSGQFKESTTKFFRTPIQFENIPKMTDIACGSWHSLAIDINDNVWGWGKNHFGMLGLGDTISHSFPVKIDGIDQACKIGGGCFQSIIVDKEGIIWTFGDNPSGQLGLMDEKRRLTPTKSLLSIDGNYNSEKAEQIENDKYWRRISLNNFYKLIRNNPVSAVSVLLNLILLFTILSMRKKWLQHKRHWRLY